jgi:hypothetical protein
MNERASVGVVQLNRALKLALLRLLERVYKSGGMYLVVQLPRANGRATLVSSLDLGGSGKDFHGIGVASASFFGN